MDDVFSHHEFYLLDENGNADLTQRLYTPLEVIEYLLHGLDVAVVELSNFEWVTTLKSNKSEV